MVLSIPLVAEAIDVSYWEVERMQSDIWVRNHENLAIEVIGYSDDDNPWYTVILGEWTDHIKLYMTHAQLVELVGKATNTIMTTVPTEDFFRAGPIEATYEPTDKGVAALSAQRCVMCDCPFDGDDGPNFPRCDFHWKNTDASVCPTCHVSHFDTFDFS